MKSRMLFREHGNVIHTRRRWRDALHGTLLALVIALVILVLPGLLSPEHLDAEPAAAHADQLAELEAQRLAAFAAGLRAGRESQQCPRGSLL